MAHLFGLTKKLGKTCLLDGCFRRSLYLTKTMLQYAEIRLGDTSLLRQPQGQPISATKKTVVILLGWADAKEKHLRKYSALFETHGFKTVLVKTNLINTLFFPESRVKRQTDHLLQKLKPHLAAERHNPVIVFPFSNGGCAMYFFLLRALCNKEGPHYNLLDIRGCIFDSCPLNTDIDCLPRVIALFSERFAVTPLQRIAVKTAVKVSIPFIIMFNKSAITFISELTQSKWRSPELFLYSEADKLAPAYDIKEFADARRQLDVPVTEKCWKDSPHVGHFQTYPSEYEALVSLFLERCNLL